MVSQNNDSNVCRDTLCMCGDETYETPHTHMCTHDNNGGHIFSQFRTWACAEYDMSSDVVYTKRNTEKCFLLIFWKFWNT